VNRSISGWSLTATSWSGNIVRMNFNALKSMMCAMTAYGESWET